MKIIRYCKELSNKQPSRICAMSCTLGISAGIVGIRGVENKVMREVDQGMLSGIKIDE